MNMNSSDLYRIRVEFSKGRSFQFTSNLDLLKAWERLCNRAQIPVAYSQGFHPQPKINIASPLPLGWLGTNELLDIWLDRPMDLQQIEDLLSEHCPSGIEIISVHETDPASGSIQNQVLSNEYCVIVALDNAPDMIQEKIDDLMQSSRRIRTRRGKSYDLRPLICNISVNVDDTISSLEMRMVLVSNQGAAGRPDEVLEELGCDPLAAKIVRTRINLEPATRT